MDIKFDEGVVNRRAVKVHVSGWPVSEFNELEPRLKSGGS